MTKPGGKPGAQRSALASLSWGRALRGAMGHQTHTETFP